MAGPCVSAVVTCAVTVQLLGPAASLPPLKLILLPSVTETLPSHWETAGVPASTRPPGRVSAKASPVCAAASAGFVSVKVSVKVSPFFTEPAENFLVSDGFSSVIWT